VGDIGGISLESLKDLEGCLSGSNIRRSEAWSFEKSVLKDLS
jgi:hypothetical protein